MRLLMLKKFPIIIAAFLSLAFFFGGPVIVFEKTDHDFGKIKQNSKPSHEFTFKNMGKSLLVIDRVSAG